MAFKTEVQQAELSMYRVRQQRGEICTAQHNELRGLPAEYGEVPGLGRETFDAGMNAALIRLSEHLLSVTNDQKARQAPSFRAGKDSAGAVGAHSL